MAEPARRTTARGVLAISGRVLAAVVATGVSVLVVLAVLLLPVPSYQRAEAGIPVTPALDAVQRACGGPFLQTGLDASDPSRLVPLGAGFSTQAATTGGAAATTTALAPYDASSGAPGAPVVSAPSAALVQLAEAQAVSTDRARGLAAAACPAPSQDFWLVGGATTVGQSTVLVIGNPSEVTATVDVAIFGPDGRVPASSGGLVVQAGQQRAVSMNGLAPDLPSLVVHVTSRGGNIVGQLQQSTIETLTATGLDAVSAQVPSTSLVLPGVLIQDSGAQVPTDADGDPRDLRAVRVLVVGDQPANVTVSTVPEDGSAPTVLAQQIVQPQHATQLGLEGLVQGAQTVLVSSEQPVVAGVVTETFTDAGRDYAWAAPAPLQQQAFAVAVPAMSSPVLHVYNPGSAPATVQLGGAGAAIPPLTVPPGRSVGVALPPGSYTAQASAPVQAALVGWGGGQLASLPVLAPDAAASTLLVYPR